MSIKRKAHLIFLLFIFLWIMRTIRSILFILLLIISFVIAEVIRYDLKVRSIPASPDGYPRRTLTIYEGDIWPPNTPFPGPTIRAKLGDTLNIKITNNLADQTLTIHFHGLRMINNPWMDGVHGITQCPIQPGDSFTYIFNVTQTGTYWYHSHTGAQYGDGLFGPIILSYPTLKEDPIYKKYQYDNDFTITLQDWFHEAWEDLLSAYIGPYAAFPGYIPQYPWPPTSLLLNGQGKGNCNFKECPPVNTTVCAVNDCLTLRPSYFGICNETLHPPQEFMCNGETTRIRLINTANAIPLAFWIDRHNMTIVSRDGVDIMPFDTDFLTINVGQRLDVIVRCNQDPFFKYRIYLTVPHAIIPDKPLIVTDALLVYSESMSVKKPIPRNLLASENVTFFEYQLKPQSNAQALPAVKRIKLAYGMMYNHTAGDRLEDWVINGKTFAMPHEPLLQTLYIDGNYSHVLVNKTGRVGNIDSTYVEVLEYGLVYEVLIVSNDITQDHPWHLHGYTVNFTAAGLIDGTYLPYNIGECGQNITHWSEFDFDSFLPSYSKPVDVLTIGDSFTVPAGGYVVFRFKADSSGPWMFHCHMEWHLATGLAMVFSVEKDGRYPGLVPPPRDFPVCGSKNHLPDVSMGSMVHGTMFNLLLWTVITIFQ